MRRLLGWWALGLLICFQQTASAQLFQGPYGAGNTWNVYEVVLDPLQWYAANEDAMSRTQQGTTGNLVSLHSVAENAFVHSIAGVADVWIGLTDREGAAPAGMSGGLPAPQESASLANVFTQGWAWTSGEPFTFMNWGAGEPNSWDGVAAGTALTGIEDVAHIRSDGLWNDHSGGFLANQPSAPTIQPNTSNDESVGPSFAYVVEYNTMAGSPFPGIPNPAVPTVFPPERLAGPLGTAGNWAVIDYFGDFTATAPASNVIRQILDIQSGDLEAETATAEIPYLDVADPDTSGAGGPVLQGTPFPYPSDNQTLLAPADDDMISVAHARIQVAEPGKYTFNVHSDDGFAFRIFGAEFESVQGNGSLDPVSRNTMLHAADTGDSSTRAVVNLTAGAYNVEFMSWERAGGAFYELTAAKGDFVNGEDGKQPQWIAVGDPREIPEETIGVELGVGRLTGPMEIYNINGIVPGDGLEAIRLDLLDRISDGTTTASSSNAEVFVIDDHNIVTNGCPFDVLPHDGNVVQFPNTAGNIDNFATAIFGSFTIDDGDATPGETMEISVYVASDDRSMFRVVGQNFVDVDAQSLYDIDGDEVMFADVDVCNTNFTGLIELTEGVEYSFEAFHVEAGGDSGMQVLFAQGDFLFDRDPDAFSPLAVPGAEPAVFARNIGFSLIPETEGLLGDFNSNGVLDAPDIDDLTGQSAGGTNPAAYDLNADSLVNDGDIGVWINTLFNSWVGDANLDGEFTSSDLVAVLAAGTYETNLASVWTTGDFNGDGRTTSSDLVAALAGGGYEQGPRAAVAAVPEPSSLVLVVMGALAAVGSRRRRGK